MKLKTGFYITMILLLLATGCRTGHELIETGELVRAEISTGELERMIPNYSEELETLQGNGRALISQPGASDRVSVDFFSNRTSSLVTFRNRLGIEGGQILIEKDSVLVYNRVDSQAEKFSIYDAFLTQIGTLATINLMKLFHTPLEEPIVGNVYRDEEYYVAATSSGVRLTVDRENGLIHDLQTPPGAPDPYSRISYEAFEPFNGFYLPRKITIFSRDGNTRVTLLVRRLEANRAIPELKVEIPEDVPVIRR